MRPPGAVDDPSRLQTEFVSFVSAGSNVGGYLARPSATGPRPGIVVVHDAFGLGTHFPDIARRFANVGYDALAVDMYARTGLPEFTDRAAHFAWVFDRPDDLIVEDLVAAAGYLRSLADSTGQVGCIGFCAGGRSTLLAVFTTRAFNAGISCWGGSVRRATPTARTTPARPTPPIDLAAGLACPLLLVSGDQDSNPSPDDQDALRDAIAAAGGTVEVEIFAGVGHAFFADYQPNAYDEAAAFRLWPMILDFFARTIGPPASTGQRAA
jgi:carboxymethylenebutenolidase